MEEGGREKVCAIELYTLEYSIDGCGDEKINGCDRAKEMVNRAFIHF